MYAIGADEVEAKSGIDHGADEKRLDLPVHAVNPKTNSTKVAPVSDICWAFLKNTVDTKLKSSIGYRKSQLKLFFP
jgi:hypothetical protein